MRVSDFFRLGRTQAALDFVDVDTRTDTPVFISPRAISMLPTPWADECVALIQNFFRSVLEAIRNGDNARAEGLLRTLREPNETHLGLSRSQSQGHGLGDGSAHSVWRSLQSSEAVRSGLMEDLEDTILMVPGISSDIISDITTNIIREPLISYTQIMSNQYGIPLTGGVASGPLWDPRHSRWYEKYVDLPIADGGKLILVPKAIVRQKSDYDAGEYYRHFLLAHLQVAELSAGTELVHVLKDGRRRVTKKDLMEKYGTGKDAIVQQTLNHPAALAAYRRTKRAQRPAPLSIEKLVEIESQPEADFDELLQRVLDTPVGRDDATRYEKAIESMLTALFYPDLTNAQFQYELHDGRKRIDITYTNMGISGFFHWLSLHYPASHVFVECKNYGREVGNPELDQLSSRFSPSRGRVGLLVCRSFQDKQLFLTRCKDTAQDDRGFVIALDDEDIRQLVEIRRTQPLYGRWPLLNKRFTALIS
jgi:hypothetical protein